MTESVKVEEDQEAEVASYCVMVTSCVWTLKKKIMCFKKIKAMSACLQLKVGLPTSYPRNIQYRRNGSEQHHRRACPQM